MSKDKKAASGVGRMMLVGLLSLGIGAGGFWYYTNNVAPGSAGASLLPSANAGQAPVEPPAVLAEPIFYELEPFTITYKDAGRSSILYVGLTIQLQDALSRDRLERYLPVARSRILTELGDIDASALSERETKDAIRATVARVLAVPFQSEAQRQHIADVLFTAFVIQ